MPVDYFKTDGVLSTTSRFVTSQNAVFSQNFLGLQKIDSRFTYSRASVATRINPLGNHVSVAAGTPRFDYDPVTRNIRGLLLEEERTNLALWSADSTNAAWSNGGTPTVTNLPADGIFTPTRVASSGINWHRRQSPAVIAASTNYAITVFFKPGTSNKIWCELYNSASATLAITGSATSPAVGNNQSFTIVTAPSVKVHANGIYALTFVASTTTAGTYYLGVGPNSTTVGEYIDLYGVQVEAGIGPTSFIVTGATSTTRNRDSCHLGGTSFSSLFNASTSATLLVEHEMSPTSGGFSGSLYGSSTNYTGLTYAAGSGSYAGNTYYVNGTTYNSASPSSSYADYGKILRAAVSYDSSSVVTFIAGNKILHSGTYPGSITPVQLTLGARSHDGDFEANVWIRKVDVYTSKFNDDILTGLTSIAL